MTADDYRNHASGCLRCLRCYLLSYLRPATRPVDLHTRFLREAVKGD